MEDVWYVRKRGDGEVGTGWHDEWVGKKEAMQDHNTWRMIT